VPEDDSDLQQTARPPAHLLIDDANFAKLRRPALYALVNTIVSMFSEMGRAWNLKPAELQVFMIIGVAGLQRFVRMRPLPLEHSGDAPLPADLRSGISRRQIAELTGLSRESVRRTVLKLMERQLVVEPVKGLLVHPPGMMRKGSAIFSPDEMLRPYISMVDQLVRMGIVKVQ
jgi:hypothetical protein